jgi:hypothetical protein
VGELAASPGKGKSSTRPANPKRARVRRTVSILYLGLNKRGAALRRGSDVRLAPRFDELRTQNSG